MKAVVYARYSSDKQRESSIADQVRNCEGYANREGIQILHVYQDQAVSGSVRNREAYQQMLTASETGLFQVLLVDDLSRLSRDDIEMKRVIRLFNFKGLRIIGVSDGYDSHSKGHKIHAGMKGLMNELYLDDLREKTHRGMSGQALKGFNCGGRTYGYRNVPIEDTSRKDQYGRAAVIAVKYEIEPEQAKWVQSIFEWYAKGSSYQKIAARLNELGVPSSRGGTWAISAVKVILENEMYRGQVIWNRREWLKNPETGKRTYRARPKSEWVVTENPDLRIISEELWQNVHCRKPKGKTSYTPPARRYLFSGLLSCGDCGGNFTMTAGHRYGCANHKSRGKAVCTNSMTVPRHIVERLLLKHIKEEILSEKSFKVFCKEVEAALNENSSECEATALRQQLAQMEVEHANIMKALRMGIFTPSIQTELENIEAQITNLKAELSAIKKVNVASVLPKAKERFSQAVTNLEATLEEHTHLAREIIRPLVGGNIVLYRNGEHLEAELTCCTSEFLSKEMGISSISMVAGARFELTTFRL